MMDFNKYLFGSIAIAGVVALQIGAWYFGHNGQFTALTTGVITALLGFLLGIDTGVKKIKKDLIVGKVDLKK